MLSKLSRSRSPRRHVGLKRFVRSTPKMRRNSGRFAVTSARKSTVPKLPVTAKKEGHQRSHHTFPTEAARSHDAQFKHTELTERTNQAAKPKPEYLDWKPSEIDLRRHVVKKALSRWQEVCTYLGVTYEQVKAADANNPRNVQQAFFESLMQWHSGCTTNPVTWESVLEALNASELTEVAKNIQTELAGQQSRIVPGLSTQSAMSPINWLEGSQELHSASEEDQQDEIFFPELQPLERVYRHLMGTLARNIHDAEESMRFSVSKLIQQFLRKPIHGVRMGGMPEVSSDAEELYSYIAKKSNCLSPFIIQEVVTIMCIDELSEKWKDYVREFAKCLGIPLYSGRRKKVPLIEADDLTSMSVKFARNPEQFPISRVIALRKYFQESVALDIAIFQGYTPSSTVLYFAIPRATVPFMPSLLLSHVAQLKRLEVQKIVVFGYFAVDLEEAQAVALADVHTLTKLKHECEKHKEVVASTFDELQLTRAELKHSRDELELSRSEAMATQLKLKFKEEEFSKKQKLAENAKQFLEIHVEELEKKLKIESPGQYSKEDVIMQQLAKHFPPLPPSLEIGEKLPFTPYSTFSTVYSGTLEGEPVMVKTISHPAFEATGEMEDPETVVSTFAEEFRTLQALNHPQVLSLKEAFHDKASKELIVVMETAKESLGLYLKARQGETSYHTQLQICSELIGGVLFLYDRNPPIVHGNLNDVNVMMTEEGLVKIDIGDSVLKCNPVNMLHLLPEGLRYLPSEAFMRSHTAEEETDVFSLGVLLLQIATQKAPCVEHDGVGLTPEAEQRSDDLGELDDQHPLKPIIVQCLQHFPRDRPKVALLCSQVQSLIDHEEIFILPEQPESVKAKGNGISKEGATDELERQHSLETQAMKLHASTDESAQQNDEPKVSRPESAVLPEEFAQSLSWLVDSIPQNFKDLEDIFLSFNEERKCIESALEASLNTVQSLDELVNGSASLMSLEDYHPAPAPHATDSVQPTASPSAPVSGGAERLNDRDTCTTQANVACELDPWKRRFKKLLTKHSQLLHAHGMDVDEEMRSLSLSEDEDSISTSTPSQQEHSLRQEVSALQEELSCVQEELSRVQEEYAREREEMREKFSRTTEEQLPLQNEAESLTGVKDTDCAYHEMGKKHQLVQTTPEEFLPEHGIAEQEMHDEATGKKLDSLEEEWVMFEAITRLVKQLKTDLESLRERAIRKIQHHTQLKVRLSLPTSMREVGEYLVDLAPQMREVQNERDQLHAKVERLKVLYPQLLNECEETTCSLGKGEQPQSANFFGNKLQSLGDYLRKQESSECTERTSEREEQLERQVAELEAEVDRLLQQLASTHITYPEADLSSDQVSESLSRVEDTFLMRSQPLPEKLLTAHKKIEVLEEINDRLMAEMKEAESTLERSLKTVQCLDESLEEQKLEKFSALRGVKELKSLLEGLKERVAKKPMQKAKSDTHSRRLPSPALEEPSLLSEVESLQKRLAGLTEEAAKEVEQANYARQEMREIKEQLERTVAEKLQLEKEVERLYRAKAEEDAARTRTPPSQSQGEGVLMSEVKTLKLELARVEEELQTARRDADQARQERREMKDRLDSTFGEKLVLEDELRKMRDQLDHTVGKNLVLEKELEVQKKKAREWKIQLDETTAKLFVKEGEVELLEERLRRWQK